MDKTHCGTGDRGCPASTTRVGRIVNPPYWQPLDSSAGKPYPKGLWTHSFPDGRPADVVYNVAGQGYLAFAADVGLDDASGGGSVEFQVLVDGKITAQSPVLLPRKVHKIRVDMAGAKEITLRVLNGGDGYRCDHAAWGVARFLQAGTKDPLD